MSGKIASRKQRFLKKIRKLDFKNQVKGFDIMRELLRQEVPAKVERPKPKLRKISRGSRQLLYEFYNAILELRETNLDEIKTKTAAALAEEFPERRRFLLTILELLQDSIKNGKKFKEIIEEFSYFYWTNTN